MELTVNNVGIHCEPVSSELMAVSREATLHDISVRWNGLKGDNGTAEGNREERIPPIVAPNINDYPALLAARMADFPIRPGENWLQNTVILHKVHIGV